MKKLILDPCCGSKMFWFDKSNENVLFADQRTESHTLCDGRILNINPDVEIDFRAMPFEDNSFYHVVFDPPHLVNLGESSWMAKKYGVLSKTWKEDIRKGFDECMRVLIPNGTLIFKWNENQIKVADIIKIIGHKPLYGHKSGRNSHTIWMAFLKIDNS
jgi:ubiquinone/menaquinone biosynthesis C-methylase UbiE